ncbi:MAG: hypothetical protein IK137_04565 [Bacilli bacterium]|nr:hypothetical protein [Bacilli bacterium]
MKKKIIIIVIIIVVLLLLVTSTRALYTSNFIQDYYLNSKGFYFETDYDQKKSVYNFWDGSQIEFTVSNTKKDKYTEDDISYEVKCIVPIGVTCKINGTNNTYKSILKGGKESKEKIYFDLDSEEKDIEVTIKIKSISPYKKTITKEVLLHKDEDQVGSFNYELVNYNDYSLLNISNYYNTDKCFNVKWNNTDLKVSVDDVEVVTTDTNGYATEFNKNIEKNNTVSIKFYNQGNTIYDKEAFEIKECRLES